MYRRFNMGPRGRMFGHGGFRPEIFLGIIGFMFFGWIILAVLGGLFGAALMILGSVIRGLASVAPRVFSGLLSSRSVIAGLIIGLVWYFRTHKKNAPRTEASREAETGSTVDGAAVETEIAEAPAYRSFHA